MSDDNRPGSNVGRSTHNSPTGNLRIEISDEEQKYLAKTPTSVGAIIRMDRVRRERTREYVSLIRWCTTDTRARFLRLLVERRLGVTYKTLVEETDFAYDTLREYTQALREMGVLETEGKPAVVRFTDEEMRSLVAEVSSFL